METSVVRRVSIPVDGITASGAARTVLLVTGDPDLREAAGRALDEEGFRVLTAAHSGHAILACLRGGRIDVVVSELAMDDVSGPTLAERLRRHHPDLQTVYFARSGTPECEGVLVRPFTRDDLLARVSSRENAAGRPRQA